MRKNLIALMPLALLLGGTAFAQGRLHEIRDRGVLRCGVNQTLAGSGVVDAAGDFSGFDVAFCRAVVAEVFGDAGAVEFRPLTAGERFTAVRSGEVDVLIRNTTWTSSRDSTAGLSFAPVTFFDGQCDGWTTDESGLVALQQSLRVPDDHVIFDATISKEPLGPSVLHGDDGWYDVVTWTVLALIAAEELGVTSANVEAALQSPIPELQRMLGVDPGNVQGLGSSADAFCQAILQVGNYAEIYDRNLGPGTMFDVPRGLNAQSYEGGLLYAMPFR